MSGPVRVGQSRLSQFALFGRDDEEMQYAAE